MNWSTIRNVAHSAMRMINNHCRQKARLAQLLSANVDLDEKLTFRESYMSVRWVGVAGNGSHVNRREGS